MAEEYINTLSNEERETHLNMTGDDHSMWHVFTDDPYWVRRLERVGATLVRETATGREYRLPANQLSIRKPSTRREMSESEKQALVERLQAGRVAAEES